MKFKIISLIAIITLAFGISNAQTGRFTPVNLGVNINTAEYDEFNAILTPDGKTMYFNRSNHPENNYGKKGSQDVWYSDLQADGTWAPAKHLNNYINKGRYNSVLGISEDGKIFVTGKITSSGIRYKNGISVLKRSGDEFSDPENLQIKAFKRLSEGKVYNASISQDGNHIILAMTKRYNGKKLKLYHTEYEKGKWSRPQKLGSTINSGTSNEAPFLTGNNEVLYFSSKRIEGKGNYDIYRTKRTGSKWNEWAEPKLAFVDTVSSPEYESYFKIFGKKGNFGYFTSTNQSLGKADIFKVKIFEDMPFIVMSGNIINSKTEKLFTDNKDYTILVNGKKADSVKINFDSSKYVLKLPFSKKYVIEASNQNYTSVPLNFDATNINEYTEKKQDLMLTPLPYVLVSGKFLDKTSGLSITPTSEPKLIVNGVVSDSAVIDVNTSSYSIKLPHGKDYTLGMRVFKYTTITDSLNLTNVNSYKEINKPLFGEKVVEKIVIAPTAAKAIITGKVINKKTLAPMDASIPYTVVVDGRPDLVATINTATAEYTIEATPGSNYVVSAKADKFYPISEVIDLTKEKNNVKLFKDLIIAPIEVGQTIRINNIYFQTGKAILTPASFPELDKLTKFLKENPTIFVEIAGHTDNVGQPAKNLQLSKWRARAVEQYLEKNGVAGDHVSFVGYGSTKPIVPNKTAKQKAQNRRVEFVIKGI